jgi:hypothetical protein
VSDWWTCGTCGSRVPAGLKCPRCREGRGAAKPESRGGGCLVPVMLLGLAVVLTLVAWFTTVCESHGPMCGGGLQCLPDCKLDTTSEKVRLTVFLILIWIGAIGALTWWVRSRTPPGSPDTGLIDCPSCGRLIASDSRQCHWCDQPLGGER